MNTYELEGHELIGTEYFGPVLEAAFVNKLPPDSTLVRDGATIYIYRPKTEPWSGEGLPPVGSVCEYKGEKIATIIAHTYKVTGGTCAVAQLDRVGGHGEIVTGSEGSGVFRPIRTPEQIKADERLHQVRNALSAIHAGQQKFPNDLVRGNIIAATVEAMIDAGYRKFEITDDSDPA